ncbi:MAG: phosphatidate cytidylyltransferase [Thermonemataceae bacterium]|nr:phosphatidate cytidylyltransferase [Thermonemataceae bacterium]
MSIVLTKIFVVEDKFMFMFGLEKLSNLSQRIIAGIVGGGMLINAIYWSKWTFLGLFFALMLLCLWEFYGLLEKSGYKPMKILGIGLASLLYLIGQESFRTLHHIFFPKIETPGFSIFSHFMLLSFIVIPLVIATFFIVKLYDKHDNKSFEHIGLTLLGVLYVGLPFKFINDIGFEKDQNLVILGILFCLWASDSGAYFAGKSFGKHKLFERISPKKTWEGLLGGFILSELVAFILSLYFKVLAPWQWLGVSAIIVVFGTYGDLVESMLKRNLQIKDSGSLIPGHGGFLDRFDGLLIAMPFVFAFLKWE